jgi:exosortase
MVIRRAIQDGRVRAACIVLAWCAIYARLVPELVFDWKDSGDFSHGFLIPFVSIAFVVMRRDALARTPGAPDGKGAWLLALGIAIHLAGAAASEFYLQRFSMIPFLLGWIWLLEGWKRTRILLFPVLFLLFMIPPPNIFWSTISLPLQLLASRAAETSLHWANIPVVREGNVLHLEGCSLEVASACSGIRSLIALLSLAAVIAEGSLTRSTGPRSIVAKLLIVAAAVPVAVIVNTIRVTSAAFVATSAGAEAVDRFHDISGFVLFAVSFAVLVGWKEVLRWIEERLRWRPALF